MQLAWVDSEKACLDWQAPNDLHLWLICLDQSVPMAEKLALNLSVSEKAQRDRFVSTELQHRYLVGRGALRDILARYTDSSPKALEFDIGVHGKPSLRNNLIAFNLTHAGGWAVIAVMPQGAVGVDIELLDRQVDVDALVKRFFHPREIANIMAIEDVVLRRKAFFQHWTCKEAYLKMLGVGLTRPVSEVEINWNINKDQLVGVEDGDFNGELACLFYDACAAPFYLSYASHLIPANVTSIRWSASASELE